jgi:hypothetical protein
LATLTLLANHPNGGTHDLADFIKEEARNQFVDGLVHGGFIVTQGALFVCLLLLSRRLAMLGWSSIIVRSRGLPRAVRVSGLAAAVALIVAIVAAPAAMATHVLLGGIVLQATWYLALAALLCLW